VNIENLSVGSLVLPRVPTQLFSSLFKSSADGSVFSPEAGVYIWEPPEMAVIVEVFEMPFDKKKLYRVLLNHGGVGWTWDDKLLSVYKEKKV